MLEFDDVVNIPDSLNKIASMDWAFLPDNVRNAKMNGKELSIVEYNIII